MESPITTALINSSAGTIGGIVSYSIFYPLENFRTRLQVREITPITAQEIPHHLKTSSVSLLQYLRTKLHNIWLQLLETYEFGHKVYQEHGISGFYNGLSAGVFGIGVSNAIYMYWYQLLKDLLLKFRKLQYYYQNTSVLIIGLPRESKQRSRTLGPLDNILVASLAGIVNISITNPLWVIQTRQMLKTKTAEFTTMVEDTINEPQATTASSSSSSSSLSSSAAASSSTTSDQSTTQSITSKLSTGARLTTNIYHYFINIFKSIINYCKQSEVYNIIQNEGFSALYKGYAASLVLILNPTIQYVLYDQLACYIIERKQRMYNANVNTNSNRFTLSTTMEDSSINTLSNSETFLLSAFCKAISTLATFPYQVVKARQQQEEKTMDKKRSSLRNSIHDTKARVEVLQHQQHNPQLNASQAEMNNNTALPAQSQDLLSTSSVLLKELEDMEDIEKALSLYQTMVEMYQNEGSEVFFRGLIPKLIQTVSNTALSTVLHERIKDYLLQLFVQQSN